jgi:protein associated with RNAse G/E
LYLIKTQDTFEVVAESDTRYQIEIQAFWDDEKKKNFRVIGSIDDGGIRAFFPMTDDFIITRDGDFIV